MVLASLRSAELNRAVPVLRTSWPRITALALTWPVSAAAGFLGAYALDNRPARPAIALGPLAPLVVFLLAVGVLGAWLHRKQCLVLAESELTVSSGIRAHILSASNVQAVTLERFLGSRTVKLWRADGSHQRAWVAGRTSGLFRQNFDHDYHLIGQWWLANRGANWQPAPATRHAPVPLDHNSDPMD